MKIIGLTGSIGMGKSETSKIFARENIPVFDSDEAVHDLLGEQGAAVDLVEKTFSGVKVDGKIDRKKLGQRVFDDDKALQKLEEILHPLIQKKRDLFILEAKKRKQNMIVFDIPLLFEKKYEAMCDYIVVVSAPYKVQKNRVLDRVGMTEERFNTILQKQMPDHEKRKRADFIVQTDRGLEYAEKQVREIIKKIKAEDSA